MHTNGTQNRNTINIFMGGLENSRNPKYVNQNSNGRSKRSTIFIRDLKINRNDRIELKKSQAQKQAFKLVSDQFAKDSKIDDGINDLYKNQERLMDEANTAYKEANNIKEMKQKLKDSYEIKDDSQEQKDVELLIKNARDPYSLTAEEKSRLNEIGPLTDYQKDMLKYDEMEVEWTKRANDAIKEKNIDSIIIQGINIELLKSAPMIGVQQEAAEIMKQASNEIIDTLKSEAIEHIDEKLEEEKEKAEKAKEEQKELEEKLEESNPENDTTSVEQEVQDKTHEMDELERKINDILNQNALTPEDLKGISIDQFL